jgi:hypothetical protein
MRPERLIECSGIRTLLLDSFLQAFGGGDHEVVVPDVGFERRELPSASFLRAFAGSGVVKNQDQVCRGHPTDAACSTSDRIVDTTALPTCCPNFAQLHSTHVDSRALAERAIRTISSQISERWRARSRAA